MNKATIRDYIIEDASLANYTSMKVGGPADYLIEADSIDKIVLAVNWANENNISYEVIGHGTNIISSQTGFRGLVIVNKTKGINFDLKVGRVIVDGGYPLAKLVLESATHNLGGMGELFGIPGSVGGGVAVNAGTHGVSIGSLVKQASILVDDGKVISCNADWFNFGYRSSRLKFFNGKNPPIIINVIIQLQKKKKEVVMGEIAKYKTYREKSQPIREATAGSIFKNPSGSDTATNIKEKSAGYLLEQSGAKALSVGGARVSKKHANWIVNKGNASSVSVRSLIDKMRGAVKQKYSVSLEEEVEYFGDWNEQRER